ncbi:MAG: restriction endonuclease subunit S [Oscillospiraceae bacterium]
MSRPMKDSGIEWIGEIPESWGTIRFKFLHNGVNTGEAIDKEYWTFDEQDTIFYTAGLNPIRTNYSNFPEWKYTKKNDLLLARNGTPYVYFPVANACYTDHIIRADMKLDTNKRFIQYALQQSISSIVVDSVSIPTWSASLWNEQAIPYPSAKQQLAISAYLDEKCALIDSVIEKTKASIEEYKKLRQAVITQAVTKGIRGNRTMKNSGIAWIGEIPEEWSVLKFKYVATVKSNLVHPNEYQNYMQVAPDNIEKGTAKLLDCKTVGEIGIESNNHLFYKGQIVYSKIRPVLNKVIIAPFDGLCSADMYPIETTINKYFLVYMMLSDRFLSQVKLVTENRVKMPKINQEELSQILIYLPSADEQQEIADYLDKKCAEIDTLITKKEQFLKELESYKKSLIYEYVTGKKEVQA